MIIPNVLRTNIKLTRTLTELFEKKRLSFKPTFKIIKQECVFKCEQTKLNDKE